MRNAVLVSAVRTPVGKKGGVYKNLKLEDLYRPVIKEALKRVDMDGSQVDEVIFGNVSTARTPARYVWLDSGLPVASAGLTVNRACGTGLSALSLAGAFIKGGQGDVYMCGGAVMDSRPTALVASSDPYGNGSIQIVKKLSSPDRFGNPNMVRTAENVATYFGITREECDEYALRSQMLATKGYEEGLHQESMIPITIPQKKGDPIVVEKDECFRPTTNAEGLAKLKPVAGGVVTGGNASPLNDGAAAGIMMEEEKARAMGIKPLMRFVDFATTGVDPRYMGLGPVRSTQKLLQRNGMTLDDIDFIECNEAFASQTLGVKRAMGIDLDKLNIRGGAIALGHPYPATGVNLAGKAASIFKHVGGERCIITFCCGGGQGIAALFENCD